MTNETRAKDETMKRGFFSLEAAISIFILIAMILTVLPAEKKLSGEKIFAQQKLGDLLIVWTSGETNEAEMVSDARLLLGNDFEIEIGGKKIHGEISWKKISVEGFVRVAGNEKKVTVSAPLQ